MEYPVEMASFQPLYLDSVDQEYHGDSSADGLHGHPGVPVAAVLAAPQNALDHDPDSDIYSRMLATSTANAAPPSSAVHPDEVLNLSEEVFLNSQISYGDLGPVGQIGNEYNYHFAKTSTSPSVSSASSIPMAPTPQMAYSDGFFPNIATPHVDLQPQNNLTSPLHGFNRHHSTTIPVDQLNLLSIKSMPAAQASVPPSVSTEQVSKSPSPDYYYTTNTNDPATNNSVATISDPATTAGLDFNFDTLADEMASFSKAADPQVSPKGAPAKEVPPPTDTARTINPRELFTSSKIPMSLSSPALTTLYALNGSHGGSSSPTHPVPQSAHFKGYSPSTGFPNIPNLPNQASGPAAAAAARGSQHAPKFDFKMNDECYNAISYWLHNTLSSAESEENSEALASGPAGEAAKIMVNPTGIIKGNIAPGRTRPHSFSASHSSYSGVAKRRNSIQFANPSNYTQQAQAHKELDSHQMNEEDEEENDEVTLDSSPAQFEIAGPVFSAGQKNKRRKSYSTDEAARGMVENVRLEASMSYPQINSQSEAPRTRKTSSPNIQQTESFGIPVKSKVILGSHTGGASAAASTSVPVPVVPNAQGAFPCSECDKQFKRSEHLKRHIRSVHSNIRPFHCKYCEKKFSRSDNLAQHLKTHYRVDANGQTTILYGNSTGHGRGAAAGSGERKKIEH